ncbi:MAG: hypothetical protein V7647_1955 [Acidobacteriota bacterium]
MHGRVSADKSRNVRTSARLLLILLTATLAAAGCGRRARVALPAGPGAAVADFTTPYREATAECLGLKTLSASIRLSGRAGPAKLSARIDSGFAAPAAIRLEGYPRINFGGRPFFVLVSAGADSTLVMPRDARVLRSAAPAAIVEALTGVALGPADLRAIVAGCGLQAAPPSAGRSFPRGWLAIESGETSVFLRTIAGRWRVGGARRGALSVAYTDFVAGRPGAVRVTLPATGGPGADLLLRLSQLEFNPPLDTHAFEVEVPRDAVPLSLDELRRAGPLGGDRKTDLPAPFELPR